MANVLIVYATDWGSTKKMAEAVAAGVATVDGAEATLKTAEEATGDEVMVADAGSGVTGAHGQHGLAREALYRSGVRRALDAGQDEWQGGGRLCNRRGVR